MPQTQLAEVENYFQQVQNTSAALAATCDRLDDFAASLKVEIAFSFPAPVMRVAKHQPTDDFGDRR